MNGATAAGDLPPALDRGPPPGYRGSGAGKCVPDVGLGGGFVAIGSFRRRLFRTFRTLSRQPGGRRSDVPHPAWGVAGSGLVQ
jgi:hypothetical protein